MSTTMSVVAAIDFLGIPGARGGDAAAGVAVDQHRQADTAGHAGQRRHDLVIDHADAVVHALRVGGHCGGTGVHAALLPDGGRRPCGVAAAAIVLLARLGDNGPSRATDRRAAGCSGGRAPAPCARGRRDRDATDRARGRGGRTRGRHGAGAGDAGVGRVGDGRAVEPERGSGRAGGQRQQRLGSRRNGGLGRLDRRALRRGDRLPVPDLGHGRRAPAAPGDHPGQLPARPGSQRLRGHGAVPHGARLQQRAAEGAGRNAGRQLEGRGVRREGAVPVRLGQRHERGRRFFRAHR